MLSLPADRLTLLRIETRASLVPTFLASSLTGLSRDCPAKAVEAHAVAAAIAAALHCKEGDAQEQRRDDGQSVIPRERSHQSL